MNPSLIKTEYLATGQTAPFTGEWANISLCKNGFLVLFADESQTSSEPPVINVNPITGLSNIYHFPLSNSFTNIAYGNNSFVIIQQAENPYGFNAWVSNNNIDWTNLNLFNTTDFVPGGGPVGWNNIAFGNNIFVATADNSKKYVYSEDGTNWVKVEGMFPPLLSPTKFLLFNNNVNKFFALAQDPSSSYDYQSLSSNNGINWETGGYLPRDRYWTQLLSYDNKLVACAYWSGSFPISPHNTAAISDNNGDSWNEIILPTSAIWENFYYFDNKLFIQTREGSGYYSSDNGASWSSPFTYPNPYSVKVIHNDKFLIGSSNGTGVYSSDGINWQTFDDGLDSPVVAAAFDNDTNNSIFISSNTTGVYVNLNFPINLDITFEAKSLLSSFVGDSHIPVYNQTGINNKGYISPIFLDSPISQIRLTSSGAGNIWSYITYQN